MSEVSIVEDDPRPVVAELADLLQARPFHQNQYDNLCRFMIYFSLAESKLTSMAAGLGGTDALAQELVVHNGMDSQAIDDCYRYFIRRYRDSPDSDYRFNKLAPPEYVKNAIRGRFVTLLQIQSPTIEDKISFVFKVIFRLRHNLFHGEKWSYNLEDREANFSHANNVLLSCLTLTRGNMWHP